MSVWIHGVKSSTRKRKRIFKSFGDLLNLVKAVSGRESIRRALCCLWTMQNVLCFVFRINEKLFSLVCIFKIQFARQEIGNISFLFVIVDSCFLFLGLLVYI